MRIATFNILHGRSTTDGRVDLARLADAVRRLDADVLALQEVDRDQARSHGADLTAVAAEAMGAPHHRFVATLHGEPDLWVAATGDAQPGTAAYGIALLSRLPVLEWRVVALPALRSRAPVRFSGRRWPSLVRDEPRSAVAAVVHAPEGPCTVVGTHLTFIPGWNVRQLRHLVRVTRAMPGARVVMGDLNLAGDRPARVTGLHPLARAATFPVAAPDRQLDHVLGTAGVRATGAQALDLGLSDHRALVVDATF